MAWIQFFKSIFSDTGRSPREIVGETIQYKNLTIEAVPIEEGSYYRTAGYISGELEGVNKRVRFIRADQNADKQVAIDHAITKAQQIIDEQGIALLKRDNL